jgi:hypothetical protein
VDVVYGQRDCYSRQQSHGKSYDRFKTAPSAQRPFTGVYAAG